MPYSDELDQKVFIVTLRRPKKDDPRYDPFWEFGSFGLTGCHSKTLLNKKNMESVQGGRLAFAQGGNKGVKLVCLTPPVDIRDLGEVREVIWKKAMPFKYDAAPTLLKNDGHSDFASLKKYVKDVKRPSWESKFASKFRSSVTPLSEEVSREIIEIFDKKYQKANKNEIAVSYEQALPFIKIEPDKNREKTYEEIFRKKKNK